MMRHRTIVPGIVHAGPHDLRVKRSNRIQELPAKVIGWMLNKRVLYHCIRHVKMALGNRTFYQDIVNSSVPRGIDDDRVEAITHNIVLRMCNEKLEIPGHDGHEIAIVNDRPIDYADGILRVVPGGGCGERNFFGLVLRFLACLRARHAKHQNDAGYKSGIDNERVSASHGLVGSFGSTARAKNSLRADLIHYPFQKRGPVVPFLGRGLAARG